MSPNGPRRRAERRRGEDRQREGLPPPTQAPFSLKPYVLRMLKLPRLSEREPGETKAARSPPPDRGPQTEQPQARRGVSSQPAPPRPQAGTAPVWGKKKQGATFWQPQALAHACARPVPPAGGSSATQHSSSPPSRHARTALRSWHRGRSTKASGAGRRRTVSSPLHPVLLAMGRLSRL